MVGVFASTYAPDAGPAASPTEWRSHFGAWAIVSSPLILSFDLTNETTMASVWPFISNVEAIGVRAETGYQLMTPPLPGREPLFYPSPIPLADSWGNACNAPPPSSL